MNKIKQTQNEADLLFATYTTNQFRLELDRMVKELGGYVNYHSHLDRAGTLAPKYLAHYGIDPLNASGLPLRVKQTLTGELHKGPAYHKESLEERITFYLDLMVRTGVRQVVSFIDTSPDIGLTAFNTALELKARYQEKIDFKIAAYPIFGFKEDHRYHVSRWDLFEEAARLADIIGALPERDDRPDSVGGDAHFRKVIHLGLKLDKEVHIHVDQYNDPRQKQTLDLVQFVRCLVGKPASSEEPPKFWAVHSISSSAYSEDKFKEVLEGLKTYNIGVICCPRAAITMNQPRSLNGPIHNSIARVFEMAYYGIPVRIGTDNISDLFIPTSSGSMLEEIIILADSLRFSGNLSVLAKLSAGVAINRSDEEVIRKYLETYRDFLVSINPKFQFCLDLK